MMRLYKISMRTFLILRYYFHRFTRTGCFSTEDARRFTPTAADRTGSTLKAGLLRHHVKQYHESSCSVASVVSAVNTLIERVYGPGKAIVTQQQILEEVRAAHWKERMSPGGYKGKRGLPLEVLGQVIEASLQAYQIQDATVEVIRCRGKKFAAADKAQLKRHLLAFENDDTSLLIAHFDQGSFIRELNIPHISPVGGYDPNTCQVTLLDVDPDQIQPYKISFSRFYKGISTDYAKIFTPFGYARGGYVRICIDN